MTKINSYFGRYPDAEFENATQNIYQKLLKEKVFTPAFAEMTAFEALMKEYSDTLALATDGGRVAIAKKNAARKALDKMLKKVAGYVAMIAGDDPTIIVMSGFEVRKERESRPRVTTPENIQVGAGENSGEVMVSVDAVADVKTYLFEHSADPLTENSSWKTGMDTRSWFLIKGLKPGQKYWFRVAAVGLRGAKVYSNEISSFVL